MAAPVIRPGSSTANAGMLRQQYNTPGARPAHRYEWYRQRVTYRDFTTAGTSQALSLNVAFPQNTFPADVFLTMGPVPYLDLVQTFSGGVVSAATMILGITGTTNGYITSQNVFTGATLGVLQAPGATIAAANLYRAADLPLLTFTTTTGNVNTCTQGIVDVWIPFTYRPTSRGVFL